MSLLYVDCFSGASGDMFLGALLDAGAPEATVRASLDSLELTGWNLSVSKTMKGPIAATAVKVEVERNVESRRYRDIRTLLENAALPPGVKERSLNTFRLLAVSEAKIHGAPIDDVHFHEVGGLDAIVDIVGVAAALEWFDPSQVIVSPIATGRSTSNSLHGAIPVPAPAVVELLNGAVMFERGEDELITPTGAAIITAASTRFGPMPPMEIRSIGYGAGTKDTDLPNVLRIITGETAAVPETDHLLIETNLDDMNPEVIPYAIERLLDAGAADAWSTPIGMKKGRDGVLLSVLVAEDSRRAVLDVLYRETSTLGARIRRAEKDELERRWETMTIEGHPVRVKVGMLNGEVVNRSPEYEDAAKVARITGLPLKEVYRRASSRK